ncbi:MAG TPA: hypothetical protein VJ841_04715 [Candidatus Saccharimonadales bacterium]|nr:hypothetical protein [Candidatus Saccharimonadales bacterium]
MAAKTAHHLAKPAGHHPDPNGFERSWLSRVLLGIMILSLFGVAAIISLTYLKYTVGTGIMALALSNDPSSSISTRQFDTHVDVDQNDMLHIQMLYVNERLSKLTVRLQEKKSNKEVYRSGDYDLGAGRRFNLSLSAKAFDPGDYNIIVENQDRQEVARGTLTVH